MSSSDINTLTRQKELLLQKLSTFEETNQALRELLREQHNREVSSAVCLNLDHYRRLCCLVDWYWVWELLNPVFGFFPTLLLTLYHKEWIVFGFFIPASVIEWGWLFCCEDVRASKSLTVLKGIGTTVLPTLSHLDTTVSADHGSVKCYCYSCTGWSLRTRCGLR